jgi:tetratricopeptide (TPR) repeat protein
LPVLASYYLQKKNYVKAENYYQQLIKLNPKNSQYPAGLASIYIETKQTKKAEQLIKQYRYLQKDSLAFFASYYLQQKNYPKAQQHYKQLIAKNPRKRAYKKALTSIYLETKQIAKAQRLIKRYPYLKNDFLAFLAGYDLQQKNYRKAERSYKKLIAKYPKNRFYPKALTVIYVETKQMRKVQTLTKRYPFLQQELLPVLASHYLQSKNYKQAENSYKKLIALHPEKRDYPKVLASIYVATKQMRKVQTLTKSYPFLQQDLLPVLASYYLQHKNYAKAERYYQKLSFAYPEKRDYPKALASIYVETRQFEKINLLMAEFPFLRKELLPVLASYYLQKKNYVKAENYYQQLIKLNPKNSQYQAGLASIYIETKQTSKAEKLINQYPYLKNNSLAFFASYYLQQKNYPKAQQHYKQLIAKNPRKREYKKVLTSIYLETKQIAKAQQLIKRYPYLQNDFLTFFASYYLQQKNYRKAEQSYKKLIAKYRKNRDYPQALAIIYVETKQMRKVQRLTKRYSYLQQGLLPVLASHYLQKKNYKQAENSYKKLIRLHPKKRDYPKALASIYIETKQMPKAQRLIKRHQFLEQDLLPVLASYYLQQKNYTKAENYYRKLIATYPDKTDYPVALASIYVETNETMELHQLIKDFPFLEQNLLPVLASHYLNNKDYKKAETYYQQLCVKSPENQKYPEVLASIYIQTKQEQKLPRLIEQYPVLENELLPFLASYNLQQKNYPKAERSYKQLIAKSPRKRAYKKALTSIYLETKQIAKAQRLIKRYPYLKNDFLAFLAGYDLQQKNYRKAERSYKKLIAKYPKNRFYPKALATIYVETKQISKVQRLTRRYPYLKQDLLPVLASYHLQQKNYVTAEKLYKSLNLKYPEKRDYPKVLASIYVATKQMRKVQTLTKRYPFLQQGLLPVFASYYLQHKNYAKAERYYQKLSFAYPEKRDYPKALASIYVETRQFEKINLLMAEFPFLRKELLPVLASYYLQKKNYVKAENYYQQLIKLNPKNSQYPAGLASIYIETKQTSKAEKLINQYPYLKNNSLAFFASYYLQQKNYPKAQQHYKQLIVKNPRKREYKKVLTSIYLETKQIAKAQQLIKRYPYLQNDFLTFFASYYLQQKNYRKAEQSYKKLIAKHPKNRDYPQALAIIYVETKQMRKVQRLTRRYSYLQQGLLPVLASHYLQKKNYKQAENSYKKLIRLHPKKRDYPKALASIYIETKQMPKAQRLIKRHQFLEQDLLPVLASYYLQQKNYTKAENYYRKLIATYPDKTDYPVALASIYVETNETMELHQLIEDFPFLEQNLLPVLASHYLNNKDYKKAETYYQQLCVKSPENQKYPEVLASIYIQTKQEQKLPRLIEQYPVLENELLPFLASYNLQQKNYPQAETYYKKLVSRDSEKLDYLEVLASIYVQTEQKNKALPIYKKLHRVNPNKYANNLASHYLYVNKDYPKAIKILEKLTKKTNKEQYRLMLAFAYGETNQNGKKARILEQIPLKKISADLVVSLAEAYEQKGHWQKAAKILNKWQQIHKQTKDTVKVLKHQIYLYQRLGDKKRFRNANMMLLKLNSANRL